MRRGAAALIIAVAMLAAHKQTTPIVHPKLVFRVDRVTTRLDGRKLIVDASGAVATGGWDHPRLVIKKPSAPSGPILFLELVANPPSAKQLVIQTLLPVTAEFVMTSPHEKAAVSVSSQTNEIVTQIVH